MREMAERNQTRRQVGVFMLFILVIIVFLIIVVAFWQWHSNNHQLDRTAPTTTQPQENARHIPASNKSLAR